MKRIGLIGGVSWESSVEYYRIINQTTQTLRGAHYPSHTFWTGFICWGVAVLNHLVFSEVFKRQRRKA